jgi:RNA-directed DNA polymerase
VFGSIFDADLPSNLYAYRPGRNAQQAVVEVEDQLFRGARTSLTDLVDLG